MKVSIIGGGGLVGCIRGLRPPVRRRRQQHLTSSTPTRTWPRARPSTCSTAPAWSPISASAPATTSDIADSDIVVITAGLRRKPDESRLDLINRNVDLFLGILDQVKAAGLKRRRLSLVVVSNPVDVLTYLAVQQLGLPWQRVIGLGTQLDTARFRSLPGRAAAGCRRRRCRP